MKHFLLIFPIIYLCLAGCSQKEVRIETVNTDSGTTVSLQQTSTGGTITSSISINGINAPIVVLGKTITFSGLFIINIPNDLDTWSYETFGPKFPNNEKIVFSEKTYAKYFYITLGDISPSNKSLTEKDICLLQTDYNGSPTFSKETTTKVINNKDIFITQLTFFTEGNTNPYAYITHFCFLDNSIMYDLVLDNYKFSEANNIIDSFTFIN